MTPAPPLPHETERLQVLTSCLVLDTPSEPEFDAITSLVSQLTGCPIALVSLVDQDRQWFKSRHGLEATQTRRSVSFCGHALLSPGNDLVVEDARLDARFADNPLVTGAPFVTFYAGIPLRVGGQPVGTLCVIDHRPRELTAEQLGTIRKLARQVEVLLEYRRSQARLEGTVSELRRAEDRMRGVLDSMHDGMVMQRPGGEIIWHNAAACRVLGLSSDQLNGRTSTDPRWRAVKDTGAPFPGTEHPAMVALTTGQPVHGVIMGVGVGDELRWIRINSEPLIEAGHATPYAAITSFSDITELRNREVELRKARDLAEANSRAKSEFLATMSHELRTPMNGVIGMSELLLADGVEDPGQREMVSTIRNSAQSLLSIINDVLDYSKIEAGGRQLQPASLSPQRLVADVSALLTPSAHAKALTFELAPTLTPETAWGDVDATRQVLMNLVGNAIKFTSVGKVGIRVALVDGACRFEITDTGIGLSDEQIPRLFQRFSQAESSTRRRFGGTGLGLAISKKLVESMGGQIGVDSRVGEGSTFWFTLPLPPADARSAPVSVAATVTATTRSLKVLLVEDNPINQRVSAGMLERLGHTVQIASDGRKGLEAAMAGRFDVVLMDIHMPEMDGLEATMAIRARERSGARVPIIALTASALSDERDACIRAGMDSVLFKPLTMDALKRELPRIAA